MNNRISAWLKASVAATLAMPAAAFEQAQKPAIDSVTPSVARAGGSDFIVRVRGRGFTGSSVVRWNGSERVTAVIAPDLLSAMITSSDVAAVGEGSLSVFDPGAGASNSVPVPVRAMTQGAAAPRQPNPAPVIQALVPDAIVESASPAVVTVKGLGFTPMSVARLRGAPRPTRFVSPSVLQLQLMAEDVDSPGIAAVTVRNPLPGGGVSQPQLFRVEASPKTALEQPRVYPNPWRADLHEGVGIAFENLGARSMIQILTVSGAAVKLIRAAQGMGQWDLTNQSGKPVEPGSYVYQITDGKRMVEGKLRVSR